ncbi:hypothetical protein QUO15_004580 [Vibrio parahaemolyticus]|nr:hypothetical protein [Vibrio parahaemolyticus]
MLERLPLEIFQRNHTYSELDSKFIAEYQKGDNMEEIAEKYSSELELGFIDSIKTIAKALYAQGIEPNLFQEWGSSTIMGYVGEALTELVVPGTYIAPGNEGFDIEFNGELIEVKTSVKSKVSMSESQYEMANFLVAHRFHKRQGYVTTFLYPVEVVQLYKQLPDGKRKLVSVDAEKDYWAEKYEISLKDLSKFFLHIEAYVSDGKFHQVVCNSCLKNCERYAVKELEYKVFRCESCRKNATSNWSDRYCNLYIKRKARLIHSIKKKSFSHANQNPLLRDFYWRPKSFYTPKVRKKYPSRIMANVVW